MTPQASGEAGDPTAWLLARAAALSPREIDLGLERVAELLARLGDPHQGMNFVQVAGTNGKGSTCAFLESMLRRAGWSTGLYTSPHLERFHERIRVNGGEIADAALGESLRCALEAGEGPPALPATFFEWTTVAALDHFARRRPDWTVLETGLGGRLDAVTVVTPRLCLITPIALDHQAWLGASVERIAWEKAGILKPGVPCVADPGSPEAEGVIREAAARVGAPLFLRGRDYHVARRGDGSWRFEDDAGSLDLPPPGLAGGHQYGNAALALAGLRRLSLVPPPSHQALAEGVARVAWPGRLERFPGPPECWLDGAHNPAAVRVLVEALRGLPAVPLVMVMGAFRDKEAREGIEALATLRDHGLQAAVVVTLEGERPAWSAEQLEAWWREAGTPVSIAADPARALDEARQTAGRGGRVVVAGSLHLVGAVRSLLG
ncbi:MAG: bifunctional folylpolyglutamate synthase/dihydrofolate synthase [Magnetococcales bacterium]|nr:bifunctional folylpolyglutamate synthase/dihydrofolate synthase [Magnetococcales bacterium]